MLCEDNFILIHKGACAAITQLHSEKIDGFYSVLDVSNKFISICVSAPTLYETQLHVLHFLKWKPRRGSKERI